MLSKIIHSSSIEYLIVGPGNPGLQYQRTRHNAGFMCIDCLAEKLGVKIDRLKFDAMTADVKIDGVRCLLMKPQTYMNLSGDSVSKAARFYKIPNDRIIIMADDISLAPGRLRIRRSGSAGGHNGLKSIIAQLGGEDFPRIKVGVGAKPSPETDLADWVLGKFTQEETKLINEAAQRASSAVELLLQGKTELAMNRYNK